jgi:hypothetical protein
VDTGDGDTSYSTDQYMYGRFHFLQVVDALLALFFLKPNTSSALAAQLYKIAGSLYLKLLISFCNYEQVLILTNQKAMTMFRN